MDRRETARTLRRGATDAERLLWRHLRSRQLAGRKFRRQYPIGPYIVDFLCFERRLVIELDGGQHADEAHDARRTAHLEALGYRVLRFWNNEVFDNAPGVVQRILSALEEG